MNFENVDYRILKDNGTKKESFGNYLENKDNNNFLECNNLSGNFNDNKYKEKNQELNNSFENKDKKLSNDDNMNEKELDIIRKDDLNVEENINKLNKNKEKKMDLQNSDINHDIENKYQESIDSNIENKKIQNYELTQNIGFTNIGHTCYMNSFLQILLHTPSFLPKLKELYYNKVGEDTLIYNLIKLSEYPYSSIYLKEIKRIIAKTHPKYGPYVQNDTQNFAVDFIDTIISEIKKEISFISESNEDDDDFVIKKIEDNIIYKKKKYKEFLSDFEKSGEKTFIEDFFLFIESTTRYKGLLIEKNKIRFNLLLNVEIAFHLESLKDNYTLIELLDLKYNKFNHIIKAIDIIDNKENDTNNILDYSNNNQQEGNWLYERFKGFLHTINIFRFFNCCERKNGFKEENNLKKIINNIDQMPKSYIENNNDSLEISKISFLPKILIISFIRGIEGKDLISSSISFEEELDIGNFIDKDLVNGKIGTIYKLYAINIRQGFSKSFGHCFSYVRVKNEWICFNDSYVHKGKPSFNLNNVVGLYYIKE